MGVLFSYEKCVMLGIYELNLCAIGDTPSSLFNQKIIKRLKTLDTKCVIFDTLFRFQHNDTLILRL